VVTNFPAKFFWKKTWPEKLVNEEVGNKNPLPTLPKKHFLMRFPRTGLLGKL
jgi:hypothetical protein